MLKKISYEATSYYHRCEYIILNTGSLLGIMIIHLLLLYVVCTICSSPPPSSRLRSSLSVWYYLL